MSLLTCSYRQILTNTIGKYPLSLIARLTFKIYHFIKKTFFELIVCAVSTFYFRLLESETNSKHVCFFQK